MESPLVKFIKKIPPSGGGPAFKLTLPHQIVHSHLLHLVDEGFELAPTAQVQTSWQASIAPRRNKERSEYTLQGWKLFAEAHKIQAGDQVSFELVTPRRMVVQVIQAADPTAAPVRPREKAAATGPSKATKHRERTSPARNQQYYNTEEALQELWMDSASLSGEVPNAEWTPMARVSEDSSYMDMPPPCHISPPAGPMYPSKASQREGYERWVPTDMQHPPPLRTSRPSARHHGGFPSAASFENLAGRPRGSPDSMPRSSSLSALASSGTVAPASGFYSEMLNSDRGSGDMKRELSASPVPDCLFEGLLFERAEDDLVPPTPPSNARADPGAAADRRTPGPHAGEPGLMQIQPLIGHHLGGLTTTIQRLQDDANHFRAQAEHSERETAHLHTLFASQQLQLDRQAREALRAAMGLEKCATALASKTTADGGEQVPAVVSDMTGCLGVLKGTLWHFLVLASHEDDDRTHHPSPAE